MLIKRGVIVFIALILSVLCHAEDPEVWIAVEDFVKFGKKDAYEALKKDLTLGYAQYDKREEIIPILAVQDLENPEYHFLVPVVTYGGIEVFKSKLDAYHASLKEQWLQKKQTLDSLINFRIFSILEYRPGSSCIPEGNNSGILNKPFLRYYVYSLEPGNEEFFEEQMAKRVADKKKSKTSCCWRTWKVTFGGDAPKYIVCIFARTKDELDGETNKIEFIDPKYSNIVRREKVSDGVFRRDLSYYPVVTPAGA